MNELATAVLKAHGGLDRWRQLTEVQADIVTGGDFWRIKGLVQGPEPRRMTVALHTQWASVQPYGSPDQRTSFSPDRLAIETLDGATVAELSNPRDSFAGHEFDTPWNAMHRAYFNGYALWTYLTTPFFMAMPGFAVEEIEPLRENGEVWRGLQVTFPPSVASHSTEQQLYFGEDFLLRRHDYRVDVAGGFAGAQYARRYVEADGILLPTERRAYRRDAQGRALLEELMVSIDIGDIRFS